MGRTNRIKQQAYSYILSAIDRDEFGEARFLPSARALSAMTGISATTVLQAVNQLKKEGRLLGAAGHRVVLPGRSQEPSSVAISAPRQVPVRRTKQLALQSQIQRDLLNGRYRHDTPIPAEKELTANYGVSRMTLRKALRALTEQGILFRRGPRFAPVSITASASPRGQRIVLLGQGGNMGHNITYGYWHQENFKLLELECAKARIRLDVVCFQRDDTGLRMIDGRRWHPVKLDDETDVAGYLYLITGRESIDEELLGRIARGKRPVAMYDEVGVWPPPAFLKQHSNVRVFQNTLSDRPARQVARFVLELGHRTAAFVSPHDNWEYSRRRYSGLSQAFSAAGDARIIPVTSQHDPAQFSEQGAAAAHVETMMSFYENWAEGLPAVYRAPMREPFDLLRPAAGDGRLLEEAYRLYERAFSIKEATVWIVVNDFLANHAIDFLADVKHMHVPEKISIISFDDLTIASTKGITSYNFNHPAAMIAMLRFITNPRLFPVSRPVIEIEGWVVPRTTTGKPVKGR